MGYKKIVMELDKKIALVAHDHKKRDLIEWAKFNRDLLAHHKVYATGTTGQLLEEQLGFPIIKLQSGPLARLKASGVTGCSSAERSGASSSRSCLTKVVP